MWNEINSTDVSLHIKNSSHTELLISKSYNKEELSLNITPKVKFLSLPTRLYDYNLVWFQNKFFEGLSFKKALVNLKIFSNIPKDMLSHTVLSINLGDIDELLHIMETEYSGKMINTVILKIEKPTLVDSWSIVLGKLNKCTNTLITMGSLKDYQIMNSTDSPNLYKSIDIDNYTNIKILQVVNIYNTSYYKKDNLSYTLKDELVDLVKNNYYLCFSLGEDASERFPTGYSTILPNFSNPGKAIRKFVLFSDRDLTRDMVSLNNLLSILQ